MSAKSIKLGLFGFGCVGQGLYEVLQLSNGIKAEIVKICIKNPEKNRKLPLALFTTNPSEILDNPEIEVIVELIDDAEAAWQIALQTLTRGKTLVSANKKMIAEHLCELLELQEKFGGKLLYEGACCASIPIIRNLEEYYDNDLLTSVEGIFNGSTNYILDKVFDEQKSLSNALKDAQEQGFAESDPRLDIQAFDPVSKLSIIILHAFGQHIPDSKIPRLGIDRINDFDVNFAREKGWRIKLVAHSRRTNPGITAWCLPKFVQKNDVLYGVRDAYNGVSLESIFSESQFFLGKGAGSHPTGSAVLSDISALSYNYRYEYKKRKQTKLDLQLSDSILKVYIRYQHNGEDIRKSLLTIEEEHKSPSAAYFIGTIRLNQLNESTWFSRSDVNLIVMQ